MGTRTGNPEWKDYPDTSTRVYAQHLNAIEDALDNSAPATHQHTMADLTDYTPPDPGGLKVYTSWAEVDAETESTTGVLTTDDWAPTGLASGNPPRDAAFFITTQVQTIDMGTPDAEVGRRQDLRVWDGYTGPIWRFRQAFNDGPWWEWHDVGYWELPNALSESLARAEDSVVRLDGAVFNNPKASYAVGYYPANWRTLTGFAELPNATVVGHVFYGGTPRGLSSGNWVQTVVVALADGTSRTISRVSTNGTSYGPWTLQPSIPGPASDPLHGFKPGQWLNMQMTSQVTLTDPNRFVLCPYDLGRALRIDRFAQPKYSGAGNFYLAIYTGDDLDGAGLAKLTEFPPDFDYNTDIDVTLPARFWVALRPDGGNTAYRGASPGGEMVASPAGAGNGSIFRQSYWAGADSVPPATITPDSGYPLAPAGVTARLALSFRLHSIQP